MALHRQLRLQRDPALRALRRVWRQARHPHRVPTEPSHRKNDDVRKRPDSRPAFRYSRGMNTEDAYFDALQTRDHRFDGKFFVGVRTTGIYCRPICPAKPRRENVVFFSSPQAAEREGYRPCMRCRPEAAPLSPAWIGTSAVVQRAVKVLHTQETLEFDENTFAEQFGVTARHLRRLFVAEIGKTPKQLAQDHRLNLARTLLTETRLPVMEVAFAAGFSSIRRFNDAFKQRFKQAPSELRREKPTSGPGLQVSLPYRPPFDYEGLLRSYENHRVGNLEWFENGRMHRIVAHNGKVGEVIIAHEPARACLRVTIDFPDTSIVHGILSRVRSLFDLGSDPLVIAHRLESVPSLKPLLEQFPGLRLPSGWDPFEVAVAAILGQLVSIAQGRALVEQLIALAGTSTGLSVAGRPVTLFPTPSQLRQADLTPLKTTLRRKQTLRDFCQALEEGRLSLAPTQDVAQFVKNMCAIKGIGPWTAQYVAMKALRDTDAFPASDLILARKLVDYPAESIELMRPWRGYLAALLWRAHGEAARQPTPPSALG